jgi:hypothetical protein
MLQPRKHPDLPESYLLQMPALSLAVLAVAIPLALLALYLTLAELFHLPS